jgi:hypothetical protein
MIGMIMMTMVIITRTSARGSSAQSGGVVPAAPAWAPGRGYGPPDRLACSRSFAPGLRHASTGSGSGVGVAEVGEFGGHARHAVETSWGTRPNYQRPMATPETPEDWMALTAEARAIACALPGPNSQANDARPGARAGVAARKVMP